MKSGLNGYAEGAAAAAADGAGGGGGDGEGGDGDAGSSWNWLWARSWWKRWSVPGSEREGEVSGSSSSTIYVSSRYSVSQPVLQLEQYPLATSPANQHFSAKPNGPSEAKVYVAGPKINKYISNKNI